MMPYNRFTKKFEQMHHGEPRNQPEESSPFHLLKDGFFSFAFFSLPVSKNTFIKSDFSLWPWCECIYLNFKAETLGSNHLYTANSSRIDISICIMIRGIFNFSARDGCSTCTMAAFSECSTVAQNRGRAAALDDRMKHMYSESLSMGYILGANNGHSLFTSHLACSGKNCMCSDFASAFLCDTNKVVDLERTSAYLLEDRISCPFVAILVRNDQAAVLSYLSHDEIQVTMLEEGSYSIRYAPLHCSPH